MGESDGEAGMFACENISVWHIRGGARVERDPGMSEGDDESEDRTEYVVDR